MRCRRVLLLAACLTLGLALAAAGLLLYASREGVANQVNFKRVQVGMPRERVEQLLGGPGERGGVAMALAEFVGDLDDRFDRTAYVRYPDGQAAVPAPPAGRRVYDTAFRRASSRDRLRWCTIPKNVAHAGGKRPDARRMKSRPGRGG